MPTNPHPAKDDVLRQALAQAEKALKPFAEAAKDTDERGGVDDGTCPGNFPIEQACDVVLTVDDCRNARAAASAVREAMKRQAEARVGR